MEMPRRIVLGASAFVVLALALVVPGMAQAGGVVLFHRTASAYSGADFSSATVSADAPRRDLLVTQGSYNGGVCPYRSVSGAGLCVLYKEALFTESNAPSGVSAASPGYASGVSYFYANSSHPEWFLTDSSGKRIYNPGYQSYWEMDVGNSGYQNLWAQNAIAEAKQYGWNGIFADDLACWAYNTDATSVQYPTRSAWQSAVLSFITNVAQQLHAAGLKLVSNSSSCVGYPSVLHNFAAAEDGVMEEGWMRPNVDPGQSLATASSGVWGNQLGELADAERNHKYYLAELPATSSDTQGIRYGLATQLLAAGGYSSFDISGSPNYTAAFWSPDYDTAEQLGTPAAAYYELSNGVYRRDFTGGSVLVNPTGATQTVNLGGSYSGSGLTNATTATMPAQTALILTAR